MSGFNGAVEGGALHGYDVVDNLTSTETQKPLSAAQGKALKELVEQSMAVVDGSASFTPGTNISTDSLYIKRTGKLCVVRGTLTISGTVAGNNAVVGTLPEGFHPSQTMYLRLWSTYNNTAGFFSFTVTPSGLIITGTGSNTFSVYIYLDLAFMTA